MILLRSLFFSTSLIIFQSCYTHKSTVYHAISPGSNEFVENDLPLTSKLKIAPRDSNALSGSQIILNITKLSLAERENYIFNEVKKGNIPEFLRNMVKVSVGMNSNGSFKNISYYTLPDYIALGNNNDYFLCPMTPVLGQKIAAELDCFLPTRKMVDQIWNAATVKMTPEPIPPSPDMTTVSVFKQHDSIVWLQRSTFLASNPLGSLVSGHKKDLVISNLIYTSGKPLPAVIYGWHYKTGKYIQPLYSGHHANYTDYSHGVRLIQKMVFVGTIAMQAPEVLKSKELHSLLSDEGPISKPYYPYQSIENGQNPD